MSKIIKELGGKTSAGYSLLPEHFTIFGHDTEAPEGSCLVETDVGRLKVDKPMMHNIASRGVLQPIQCRIVGESVVVVNGRRRIVNARAANEMRAENGLEPLPVKFTLETGGDNSGALLTMVSTNHFTASHGPMAQATKAEAMLNAGISDADVANSMGFSVGTLRNRVKLLGLPKGVQKHVDAGAISPSVALELLKNEEPAEITRIADELVADGGPKRGQGNKAATHSRADDAEERAHKPPTRTQLLRVIGTEEFLSLSDETQRVIRWVTGGLKTPQTIDGMGAAWKASQPGKKPPKRIDE